MSLPKQSLWLGCRTWIHCESFTALPVACGAWAHTPSTQAVKNTAGEICVFTTPLLLSRGTRQSAFPPCPVPDMQYADGLFNDAVKGCRQLK